MLARGSHRLVTIPVIALALGACAPRTTSTSSGDPRPEPQPADRPMRLYQDGTPHCPYEEIGTVTVRKQLAPADVVLDSLRARAREMGGDAVIGIREKQVAADTAASRGQTTPIKDTVVSGVVIRFRDEGCSR